MNALLNPSTTTLTMSTREIAELTGKEHFNVLIDAREIFAALEIADLSFQGSYKDSTGRTLPMFNLPKRETLILVSGYSLALRAKIIDRWKQWSQAPPCPTSRTPPCLSRGGELRLSFQPPSP